MSLPLIHVARPDGGFEMRPMQAQDVLSYVEDAGTVVTDLLTIARAVVDAFNAKGEGARLDAEVTAVEANADLAEASKLATLGKQ